MRSFNPENKFIPVDFQVARLLDFDKAKADGMNPVGVTTPLVCNTESEFYPEIDQMFGSSGAMAEGIWGLIERYNEDFADEDKEIEECENPSFTEAQKLGARAFFIGSVFFLRGKDDERHTKAREKVVKLFSSKRLDVKTDKVDVDEQMLKYDVG